MQFRRLIQKVDAETGEVLEEISPSKVLSWLAVLFALAVATMWLLRLEGIRADLPLDDFVKVEGLAAGFAIVMYSRAGDLVDLIFAAGRRRLGADDG